MENFAMNRILLVTLLMSASLIAKGSTSPQPKRWADDTGNCTPQFIQDYNEIVYQKLVFKDLIDSRGSNYDKMSQIMVIDDSCKKFFSSYHSKVSCKALSENQERVISNVDHVNVCQVMSESLKMAYGETYEENNL
jgi:hypothetical protein